MVVSNYVVIWFVQSLTNQQPGPSEPFAAFISLFFKRNPSMACFACEKKILSLECPRQKKPQNNWQHVRAFGHFFLCRTEKAPPPKKEPLKEHHALNIL
jgi:hypothetical protein